MRKNNFIDKNSQKAGRWIRKTCMVIAAAAVCSAGAAQGAVLNAYPTVQAASVNSLSSQKPVFQLTSRTGTTAKMKIHLVSGASYYKVYRSTSKDGKYTLVGSSDGAVYKDTGLKAKKAYYYKIKASNGSSTSKYSDVMTLNSTLDKVLGVKASCSNSNATISWTYLWGASQYKVYRSASENGTYAYLGSTTKTSYLDSTVKDGQTYYYKVRGVKTSGSVKYNGKYSAAVKVTCQSAVSENSFIDEVLRLVNVERSNAGLKELTTTSSLKQAAYQRAVEIKSVFAHNRPDGSSCFTALDEFNVSYMAAGENIAYGQKSPAQVVETWMNSEGHRANILSSKFGKIGVGCYESNGTYYWTQMFTN